MKRVESKSSRKDISPNLPTRRERKRITNILELTVKMISRSMHLRKNNSPVGSPLRRDLNRQRERHRGTTNPSRSHLSPSGGTRATQPRKPKSNGLLFVSTGRLKKLANGRIVLSSKSLTQLLATGKETGKHKPAKGSRSPPRALRISKDNIKALTKMHP